MRINSSLIRSVLVGGQYPYHLKAIYTKSVNQRFWPFSARICWITCATEHFHSLIIAVYFSIEVYEILASSSQRVLPIWNARLMESLSPVLVNCQWVRMYCESCGLSRVLNGSLTSSDWTRQWALVFTMTGNQQLWQYLWKHSFTGRQNESNCMPMVFLHIIIVGLLRWSTLLFGYFADSSIMFTAIC